MPHLTFQNVHTTQFYVCIFHIKHTLYIRDSIIICIVYIYRFRPCFHCWHIFFFFSFSGLVQTITSVNECWNEGRDMKHEWVVAQKSRTHTQPHISIQCVLFTSQTIPKMGKSISFCFALYMCVCARICRKKNYQQKKEIVCRRSLNIVYLHMHIHIHIYIGWPFEWNRT